MLDTRKRTARDRFFFESKVFRARFPVDLEQFFCFFFNVSILHTVKTTTTKIETLASSN